LKLLGLLRDRSLKDFEGEWVVGRGECRAEYIRERPECPRELAVRRDADPGEDQFGRRVLA